MIIVSCLSLTSAIASLIFSLNNMETPTKIFASVAIASAIAILTANAIERL